jgi:hypothetical protein
MTRHLFLRWSLMQLSRQSILTLFHLKLSYQSWIDYIELNRKFISQVPQCSGILCEQPTFVCQSSSSSNNNSSQFKIKNIWEFSLTPQKRETRISKKCMYASVTAISPLYCHMNVMLWLNCTQFKQ